VATRTSLADLIVQVRADMDKLRDDVVKGSEESGKKGGERLGKTLGDRLNAQLKSLSLNEIDIKADPKGALAEIDRTEARLRSLSRDSATVEIKVKTEKALSDLGRFKRSLGTVGDGGTAAGSSFISKFTQSIATNLALTSTTAGSPLVIAGATIGLIMAPTIGAAIGGAIAGGVGLGGIIGGIALVAKDPAIAGYGKRIGTAFMEGITASADVFRAPVLNSLSLIEAASGRAAGRIGQIFKNTAPSVDGLTRSVIRAADSLGVSLVSASANSAPALKAFGSLFENVGGALSNMITRLSGDSKQGASALNDLSDSMVSAINVTTNFIDNLAHVKGAADGFDNVIDNARFNVEDFFTKMSGGRVAFDITADGFKKGSAEAEAYRNKVTGTASAQDLLLLSGQKTLTGTNSLTQAQRVAAVTADDVSRAQKGLAAVQSVLSDSLAGLGGATSLQGQRSNALRTAMDNLYGATIRQSDANQTYQASWDSLSDSIKNNGHSLDIHTVAGRANRTALESLFSATGDLYVADIAAGASIAAATKKHDARTEAVRKESIRLGLNKAETERLNNTYGKIPPKKTTDLILSGVNAVVAALKDLYVYQRALATGRTVGQTARDIAHEQGLPKSFQGPIKGPGGQFFASGGQIGGWSPSSTADNVPIMATAKEWVHPVDSVQYYGPQIMAAIQNRQVPREVLTAFASGALGKMGDLPFFAGGGQVGPVDTSGLMKFVATMSRTHIMSRAEAASKIPIGSGPGGAFVRAQDGKPYVWASAGPGGYDCSGIVSAVYNVLHGNNPYSHTFSTGGLPGNWFTKSGIGGPLTAAWSNPGEAPASSTTGHMMGMVNGLTFESSGGRGVHLGASTRRLTDFAHIAHYARGGQVPALSGAARIAKTSFADSGRLSLAPGLNLVGNGTGATEHLSTGGVTEFHAHFHGPVASKQAAKDMILEGYNALVRDKKIPQVKR
jgi:hypothetical protein